MSTPSTKWLRHPDGRSFEFPTAQADAIMAFPEDRRGGWEWLEEEQTEGGEATNQSTAKKADAANDRPSTEDSKDAERPSAGRRKGGKARK